MNFQFLYEVPFELQVGGDFFLSAVQGPLNLSEHSFSNGWGQLVLGPSLGASLTSSHQSVLFALFLGGFACSFAFHCRSERTDLTALVSVVADELTCTLRLPPAGQVHVRSILKCVSLPSCKRKMQIKLFWPQVKCFFSPALASISSHCGKKLAT